MTSTLSRPRLASIAAARYAGKASIRVPLVGSAHGALSRDHDSGRMSGNRLANHGFADLAGVDVSGVDQTVAALGRGEEHRSAGVIVFDPVRAESEPRDDSVPKLNRCLRSRHEFFPSLIAERINPVGICDRPHRCQPRGVRLNEVTEP